MGEQDPDDFLNQAKRDALTAAAGRVVHAAGELKIDAGEIIGDEVKLVSADQLSRKARIRRWRALYPVRELVHTATSALRHAADRLDAEWERTEDSLCALKDGKRMRRAK